MMLRILIFLAVIAIFVHLYGPVLFSRAPLLSKLKRIPVQTAVFAVLAFATVNGFRGDPEVSEPSSPEVKQTADVETTAAIAPPVAPEPCSRKRPRRSVSSRP